MIFHAKRWQVERHLREDALTLVEFRRDGSDAGIYDSRFRNSFGTPLLARGTREECVSLIANNRRSAQ